MRRKRRKKQKSLRILPIVLLLAALAAVVFFAYTAIPSLFGNSKTASRNPYPVKGIDVSSYQKIIDWKTVETQNIRFAFIKATEGSTHRDPMFHYNWHNIRYTDIRPGAYHFLNFDCSGKSQALNFIKTVPRTSGMLPPVVDVEYYGRYMADGNHPSSKHVRKILTPLLKYLEKYYGQKPIIYCSSSVYLFYIALNYKDYDVWFSNPGFNVRKYDKHAFWKFCQYSFKGRVDGIHVKHVDLNVFNGTLWDFKKYQ